MTTEQHKKNLAVIHILKKQYDLSEDLYRSMLQEEFCATSSTELTLQEQEKFIHILNFRYNEDYKRGYNRALKQFVVSNNSVELFKQIANPTQLELKLFKMLENEDQEKLLLEMI